MLRSVSFVLGTGPEKFVPLSFIFIFFAARCRSTDGPWGLVKLKIIGIKSRTPASGRVRRGGVSGGKGSGDTGARGTATVALIGCAPSAYSATSNRIPQSASCTKTAPFGEGCFPFLFPASYP